MAQLQKDFADIEEMLAQNRRANYERALREYEQSRDAEVIAELRRRLAQAEKRVAVAEARFQRLLWWAGSAIALEKPPGCC